MFEKIISKNPEGESALTSPPVANGSDPVYAPEVAYEVDYSNHLNILLPDVEIKGTVRFEDDLIVKGRIDGEIESEGALTIGDTAKVKAEIVTGSVVVNGLVHGNITATDSVVLQENAEVIGDITAATLSMAAGAVFVGTSTVGAPSKSASAPPKSAPQAKKSPDKEKEEKSPAPPTPPKAPTAS